MTALYFKDADLLAIKEKTTKRKFWQKSLPIPKAKVIDFSVNGDVFRPDIENEVGRLYKLLVNMDKRFDRWETAIRLRRIISDKSELINIGESTVVGVRRTVEQIHDIIDDLDLGDLSEKVRSDTVLNQYQRGGEYNSQISNHVMQLDVVTSLLDDMETLILLDVKMIEIFSEGVSENMKRMLDHRIDVLSMAQVHLDSTRTVVSIKIDHAMEIKSAIDTLTMVNK